MATSISYSSTASGGKTLSKSVTDINPNIDNAVAKTFTQKLNALTTNTLSSINRVDKTEIDPNITYYDVKLTTLTESDHITFDANTNTVTIDAASASPDTEETIGFHMNIVVGGATIAITNKPRIIDWLFSTNDEFAIYPMSGGTDIGISFIKAQSGTTVSDKFTITFAGGSFVVNGTTYNYSPVTITFVINA